MRNLLVAAALTAAIAAGQFIITNYAGGSPPPTPAPALTATIGPPKGVAVDAIGNVYFTSRHCVFKVDRDGVLTRIAGNGRPGYSGDGGPADKAELSLDSPGGWRSVEFTTSGGIAVDSAGNVYIADSGNYRVRRVSTDGYIATVAGNGTQGFSGDGGPATSAQLDTAVAVAVDAEGSLYIADDRNRRVRKVSPAGIITTVAGNGSHGSAFTGGDGGPADAAPIGVPLGVAVDSTGHLYIATAFLAPPADFDVTRIRLVSPDGIITSLQTGSNMWGGDEFFASAIAADASGNLHISGGGRVARVARDGSITPTAAVPGGVAVAADNRGNIYIANADRHQIQNVSGGVVTPVAGNGTSGDGGPVASALLDNSYWNDIAVDAEGNVYLPSGGLRVRRITRDGTISPVPGTDDPRYAEYGPEGINPNEPSTVAVGPAGELYIASRHRIYKVSGGVVTRYAGTNDEPGHSGDGGPATAARLFHVRGLAVDSSGNLYAADGSRVRKISPDGIITTVAGGGSNSPGDGGPATSARLNKAWAFALDKAGNLYIADIEYPAKYRIRKVSPDGIITTVAGDGTAGFSGDGGPATSAQLNGPSGLAVDDDGNLFIADTYNHRIRMVSPDGVITTVAGTGEEGHSGDGGPATRARLGTISGLAVDRAGNMYVRDLRFGVVRRLQRANSGL